VAVALHRHRDRGDRAVAVLVKAHLSGLLISVSGRQVAHWRTIASVGLVPRQVNVTAGLPGV
jgi:hypothetical protein